MHSRSHPRCARLSSEARGCLSPLSRPRLDPVYYIPRRRTTGTTVAEPVLIPSHIPRRRHVEPDARKMAELLAVAKDNDVPVDATSGAALQV